jgi:hypothetical protein
MLKNLAASAALVLFAGIVCAGDGVAFTSPDGKFKAQFPAQPKETEQKTAGGAMKMYTAMQGSTTFAITAVSLPNTANATPEALDKILDSTREALVTNLKAKLVSQDKVQLDKKYPGRDFVIELTGGSQMRDRIFLVEGTLYQIIVQGADANALKSKEVTTFFDSFKVAK